MDSEIYRYIEKKTLLTLDEHFVSPRSQDLVLFYELFMT